MESAVTVLPEPELADERHGLGLADVEGDMLDGMSDVAPPPRKSTDRSSTLMRVSFVGADLALGFFFLTIDRP